ncbi:unnamed protein product [Cochlearia groenlandica]
MYTREELEDMEYRYYSDLKDGTRKVKISESLFTCPFCYRDRKREYHYEDLRRHVSSVIRYSSRGKDARDEAKHRALERYMRKYLCPREREGGIEKSKFSSPCIVKDKPKTVFGDDPGKIDKEIPTFSPKRNSSLGNEDKAYPAKRACFTAGAKEGEAPVQQIGLGHGNNRFAPNYPKRRDSVCDGNGDQMFAYPWKGILANITRTFDEKEGRYAGESGTKLKEELISKGFNPHKVQPLWNFRVGNTGFALVHFGKDWGDFRNATMFDKHFEVNQCGKRDYDAARDRGDKLYGWIAKEADFHARTIIGDYLRKQGDLKSVSGKEAEDQRKTLTLVSTLENTLETKSTSLQQMESKYKETSTTLEKMMVEKDEMINTHNDKMNSMQQAARDYLASIYQEHEETSRRLAAQRIEYEEREKYLDKSQALNKMERRKLQWHKQKNLIATQEQNKVDEDMMRLAEQHQRDKDEMRKKVRELEQKLDAEHALELELERMRGDVQVREHMQNGEDPVMKEKIEKAKEELKEKEEEAEYQESIYQALVVKHGYTNDELQDARKALIKSMRELSVNAHIRVKKMGELDDKPFQKLAKERYPAGEADEKAAELSSLWDDHLRDSGWHPFMVITKNGTPVEVLNEEDEMIEKLKKDMGKEVFEAVTQALKERIEYNGSGRYVVPELWNFEKGRKATLKEGVVYLLDLWKKKKPKPKRK